MCNRNTVRESSQISFFCGGNPLYEVVRQPENTEGELTGLLDWLVALSLRLRQVGLSPSFEQPIDLCFQSQNFRPYIVFSSPMRKYEHPLCLTYFSIYGWLSELTYFPYFLVICWSYLRTEISVTICKKLYSRHHLLYFSFLWNRFVDVILPLHWTAKFVVAS